MRPKSIVLLVLALGCGLVAALGINQVLASRTPEVTTHPGETVPIFVATTEIGMGDPITPQNAKLEAWPKDKVPPGALLEAKDIEGRRARVKFYAGEPLLEVKLLAHGASASGPADQIPPGYRLVPVKVETVTSAELISPGDRVDLMVHLAEGRGGVQQATTKTFLRNVKIFAVDRNWSADQESQENGKANLTRSISLVVTPEQAELVALATDIGKIRITMRSPFDNDDVQTEGADLQTLLSNSDTNQRQDENESLETAKENMQAFASVATGVLAMLNTPSNEGTEDEASEADSEEEAFKPEAWRMVIWDADVPRVMEIREGEVLPVDVTGESEYSDESDESEEDEE